MDRQVQVSCLKLLLDTLLQTVCVTYHAEQSTDRQVLVDQCLGLISLEFGRVIRVAPEIAGLKQWPINLVEISQIRKEICPLIIGMAVGEQERPSLRGNVMQTGHEDQNFLVGTASGYRPSRCGCCAASERTG